MKKLLFLFSLLASLICAQTFQIKQITNLNADCRNLSCGRNLNGSIYYTFEAHKGNSSDVYLGQYFTASDSFTIVANVTNDNFRNINPKLIYSNDSLFIIYQTNKNGNWDIAYKVYSNSQFSPVYYAADSSADEINPVVTTINELFWSAENHTVSYEKGNSVFIKDVNIPNSIEIEIFKGNDSTKYSQVSHEFKTYDQSQHFITARKVVSGKSFIVYKQYSSSSWSEEIVLVNTGNCRHPKIHQGYQPNLSYTDDINGKSNIIYIENLSQPIDTLMLFDYPLYNYDNLWMMLPAIVTKKNQFYNYIPYTYSASKNDSLFIRLNQWDMVFGQLDTLVYTKEFNNNLVMGSFGSMPDYEVYYTIWEDSISGNIQLLGKRYLYPIGGVKDDYSPSSFTLYQNYPNPFNPGTVINFKLLHRDKVTLNIYDVMGRQICSLLNEDKPAGEYKINFDSRKYNLPSGVYFYRLTTGGYSSVKKMILIK
jgi:hypothetical protein